MRTYENLTAYLMVLYQNLKTLHYNVVGHGFFTIHKELEEAYKAIAKMCDDLIERGIPLGYLQPSIQSAILAHQSDVLPVMARDSHDSVKLAYDGYIKAVEFMTLAKDGAPSDVQSKMDEYIYYLRKEADYKMQRYIGEPTANPNIIDEDD